MKASRRNMVAKLCCESSPEHGKGATVRESPEHGSGAESRTTAVTEPEYARAPITEDWIKNITYLIFAKNTTHLTVVFRMHWLVLIKIGGRLADKTEMIVPRSLLLSSLMTNLSRITVNRSTDEANSRCCTQQNSVSWNDSIGRC